MDNNINKSFDNIFKKGVQTEDFSIKPQESEWNLLSKRLDDVQKKHKNKPIILWWFLLPLLLLLQGWTLFKWQKTNNELKELTQTVDIIKHNKITDTLTNSFSTVLYDTIYKTIIINKKIYVNAIEDDGEVFTDPNRPANDDYISNASRGEKSKILNNPKNKSFESIDEAFSDYHVSREKATHQNDTSNHRIKEKQISLNPMSDLGFELDSIKSINNNVIPVNESEPIKYYEEFQDSIIRGSNNEKRVAPSPNPDKTLVEMMKKHNPDESLNNQVKESEKKKLQNDFYLTLTGGTILPMTTGEIEITSPLSAKFSVEWQRGKHWGVSANIMYARYDYEAGEEFISRFAYPVPENIGAEYTFSEIEGIRQYLMPSIRLQYHFLPERRLNYFIGTGFTASLPFRTDIEYEYLDQNLLEENRILADYKAENRFSYVTFQGGMQYQVSSDFSLLLSVESNFGLTKPKQFNYFIPQFGMKYYLF